MKISEYPLGFFYHKTGLFLGSFLCILGLFLRPMYREWKLFLMYINDMPDSIKSNIRLFADDTIMYLTITNHSDCQALQSDLTTLESWESEWLIAFNPEKCEVIRITKKKKKVLFDYKLHGITLTKNAKYLVIQISDDLAWSKHINQMTTKSNNTLKFIKRNIQTNIHKIKETAYKTYVRIY